MASDKQIEANRLNAQKSTGPRTDEGKRQTRLNALSHGFRAESIHVLPHEDWNAYQNRLQAWHDEYDPRSAEEHLLVQHAAAVSWKVIRADRYETFHLAQRATKAAEQLLKADDRSFEEAITLASFDPSNEGERLRRYQFTLHRELRRTLERLAKLRDQRLKQSNQKAAEASTLAGKPTSDQPRTPDFLEELSIGSSNPQNRPDPNASLSAGSQNHTNRANFGRPSTPNQAKKPIDLDQEFVPRGVKCTPLDQISCLKS